MTMRSLATVFAVGARTPLGPDATSSALLLRAATPALGLSAIDAGDGEPTTMAYDLTLDPFAVAEERGATLARLALADLVRALPPGQARSLKTRACVALPEPYPGQAQSEVGAVLSREVRAALGEILGQPEVDFVTRGSAGFAHLLPAALGALGRREVDAVVAGGVHTDYDPMAVRALAAMGRLFSPDAVDAVIPGESAAFVLIARPDYQSRLGLAPLCDIVGLASDKSDITPWSDTSAFDASTLAGVFRAAAADLPDELRIGWAYGDHGVEHYRVRELFAAITRCHKLFCEPMTIDSPPQRIGRTGAASLPLFLALAADAYRRGYAPTPIGLLFAGSDGGERGAILVSSPG
jgi:3-oxoacyl-[acyl-carrier-protein] synthase-1